MQIAETGAQHRLRQALLMLATSQLAMRIADLRIKTTFKPDLLMFANSVDT